MAVRILENISEFVGKKFGRLTLIKEVNTSVNGRHVLVICDCGSKNTCRWSHIKSGRIISCGCYAKEMASKRIKKHGLHGHKLYAIRRAMISRCYNQKNKQYSEYGAKGIIVCQEWIDSFECFYKWAIENGWKEGLRVDKDIKYRNKHGSSPGKIYSPEYCSLVTHKENARSTIKSVFIEYAGESKTIAEWCEIVGISQKRFYSRRVRGWSIEDILSTPLLDPSKRRSDVNKKQN